MHVTKNPVCFSERVAVRKQIEKMGYRSRNGMPQKQNLLACVWRYGFAVISLMKFKRYEYILC